MAVTPTLATIPDDALQAELDRRARIKRAVAAPPLLTDPDLTALRKLVVEDLAQIAGGHPDHSMEHYIFEEAMTAFFGSDVWTFIRNYQ